MRNISIQFDCAKTNNVYIDKIHGKTEQFCKTIHGKTKTIELNVYIIISKKRICCILFSDYIWSHFHIFYRNSMGFESLDLFLHNVCLSRGLSCFENWFVNILIETRTHHG